MLSAAAFVCALLILTGFASSAEVEDQHEFNYEEGSDAGPENWGNIKAEWATCGDGLRQSPIDLDDSHVSLDPSLGELELSYVKSQAILKNRGHDIAMEWPNGAGYLTFEGVRYTFLQLHWHSPSEHTINSQRYDLEMHMVHQSEADNYVVVGVLFQKALLPDYLLTTLAVPLPLLASSNLTEVPLLGLRRPWKNLEFLTSYYLYKGSLTTPPCTEAVTWIVMDRIMPVHWRQVDWLRSAVHDGFETNARPLQQLNGRNISKYSPSKPYASPTNG